MQYIQKFRKYSKIIPEISIKYTDEIETNIGSVNVTIKAIATDTLYFLYLPKEIEHLQMTLVMVYTCTFLVFHIVIQQKPYPDLKKKSCLHLEMMQKYKPEKIFYNRMKISKFIVDETQIKVGKDYFWLWVAIKPKDKDILLDIHNISAETCLLQNIFYVL